MVYVGGSFVTVVGRDMDPGNGAALVAEIKKVTPKHSTAAMNAIVSWSPVVEDIYRSTLARELVTNAPPRSW